MRIASRYPGAAFVLDEGESLGALLAQGQALAGSAFTDVMGVPAWKALPPRRDGLSPGRSDPADHGR